MNPETHIVSYWPMPGENMASEQVIAPALVQLVKLEGKPEQHRFVRNVTFRGLRFEHADWTMDAKGYADTQAASPAPAAMEGIGALDTMIENAPSRIPAAMRFSSGADRNGPTYWLPSYTTWAEAASSLASRSSTRTMTTKITKTL